MVSGAKDGDALRVRAEEFLCELHHHLEASGLLEGCGTTDDGNNGQHHVHWGLARRKAEDEDHDDKADAGDKAQAEAAVTRT